MSHNFTRNVVTKSRVEDIKKRFEGETSLAKPPASRIESSVTNKLQITEVLTSLNKPNPSALFRGNIRRSPAFRCDKIVKGKNVYGQRPRSYSTENPIADPVSPIRSRVKRLHSSPNERLEPVAMPREIARPVVEQKPVVDLKPVVDGTRKPAAKMSNDYGVLETGKTPKPPARTRKPEISKAKPVVSPKKPDEYAVVNKTGGAHKSGTKVADMKKLYGERSRAELNAGKNGKDVTNSTFLHRYEEKSNRAGSKPADLYTNSLKKVLSSPLPPGPPPLKPPRTFAHTITTSPPKPTQKTPPKVSTPPQYSPPNNNTSPVRHAPRNVQIKPHNALQRPNNDPTMSKKQQNGPTFDKSTARPVRSKTESEIMLRKLENVLKNRQDGNGAAILRQRSPASPRNTTDKAIGPDRPLPTLPRGVAAPTSPQRLCLDSFNCVNPGAMYNQQDFYEKLDGNSEFFVDVFKSTDASNNTSPVKNKLRKSISVEHIYAEPFQYSKFGEDLRSDPSKFGGELRSDSSKFGGELRSASSKFGGEIRNDGSNFGGELRSDSKTILAMTEEKVVAIGSYEARTKQDDASEKKRSSKEGLHYLCTPITPEQVTTNTQRQNSNISHTPPSKTTEETPISTNLEFTELDAKVPAATKVKPSLLRLAGLVLGQDQKIPQAKIRMIMNQAFGVPIDGLPMADEDDSDSASSPEEKPLGPDVENPGPRLVPGQPLDSDGGNAMASTTQNAELTQLTERRKHYVRRVSCRVATQKSPDAFPHLFHYVLLVGLNLGCGINKPYIKHKYPPDAVVTPYIEEFCFPDASDWPRPPMTWTNGKRDEQSYSLVLTDEKGDRTFGYCRRVVPEGTDICLPLAYCIISPFRATGFYYKVLSELESRHGQPEAVLTTFIMDLYNCAMPGPGQSLKPALRPTARSAATLPAGSVPDDEPDTAVMAKPGPADFPLTLASSIRATHHLAGTAAGLTSRPRGLAHSATIVRRPLDLRLEECDLTQLYSALGVTLLIQVFSTLLLERKVLLLSTSLSRLSSCVEALQSILYPFIWQHSFIPVLPRSQVEYCDAPTPYIFGVLKDKDGSVPEISIADGVIVDLDAGKLLASQGDEATILPAKLRRGLKAALTSVNDITRPGDTARNVLVSEAFVRAFVELCGHYSVHIVTQQDGKRVFERESFVHATDSASVQLFLDWFSETAMFRHFVSVRVESPAKSRGVFEQRANERREEADRGGKKPPNRRFKNLGDRFKDWTPFA